MRVLRVAFSDPEDFKREYNANLANAGVFVATGEPFELREAIQVELVLAFADRSLALDGEVVHSVTAQMARAGGVQGVAVQFSGATAEVRERLLPLLAACGSAEREPQDAGQRAAPRVPARVPIAVDGGRGPVEGRTRNLSRSGVLAEVGCDLRVGAPVQLKLFHPVTRSARRAPGRVARVLQSEGEVVALGIAFDAPADPEFLRLVEEIQSVEHSRLLGAISGSLAELGPQNVLQMFANSARSGTLRLIRGEAQGLIGFERGLLRYARLGSASGMKALARLLAWDEGGFEFHSRLEAVESHEAPLPLEAAVLAAVSQLDEMRRIDTGRFAPQARLRVVDPNAAVGDTSKVEDAVLDLARAGFRIQRILEVIPEPDSEIYRAIASLVDLGAVRCGD